jgi:hypothetical protein
MGSAGGGWARGAAEGRGEGGGGGGEHLGWRCGAGEDRRGDEQAAEQGFAGVGSTDNLFPLSRDILNSCFRL